MFLLLIFIFFFDYYLEMFLNNIKNNTKTTEGFEISAKVLFEIGEKIEKNKELSELSMKIAASMDEMVNDKLKNILI